MGGHGAFTASDDWFEEPMGRNPARELSPTYSGNTLLRPHIWDWQHALEVWFGVDIFLTLAPKGGFLSHANVQVRGWLWESLFALNSKQNGIRSALYFLGHKYHTIEPESSWEPGRVYVDAAYVVEFWRLGES